MGRSTETIGKKEKEKKKAIKKQEKEERKEKRKSTNSKGKGLDDMLAYIDENGNLSASPPDPGKKKEFDVENIQIGVAKREVEIRETVRQGVVAFFNESKGYGFINDQQSNDRVFVHVHQLLQPISEGDKVTFETEMGPKGWNAIKVKKV